MYVFYIFFCIFLHRNLQIQNQELPCQEKARDSTASAYSGMYPTHNIPVSKNGVRHDIPIAMQVSPQSQIKIIQKENDNKNHNEKDFIFLLKNIMQRSDKKGINDLIYFYYQGNSYTSTVNACVYFVNEW